MALTTRQSNRNYLTTLANAAASPVGRAVLGRLGRAAKNYVTSGRNHNVPNANTVKRRRAFPKRTANLQNTQSHDIPMRNRRVGTVRTQGGPRAIINNPGKQSIMVRHQERFDKAITVDGDTKVVKYYLNPGLGSGAGHMFPWLASIAQNYEFYSFRSMRIHYCPTVGANQDGHIVLAPDYDVLDTDPATGADAESYKSAVSGPLWQGLTCTLSANDLNKRSPKYVRTSSAPAGSDLKTYDAGAVYVLTEDVTAAITAGYLYVEYDVELSVPSRPSLSALGASRTCMIDFDFTQSVVAWDVIQPGTNEWYPDFSIAAQVQIKASFLRSDYYKITVHSGQLVPTYTMTGHNGAVVTWDERYDAASSFVHVWMIKMSVVTGNSRTSSNKIPFVTLIRASGSGGNDVRVYIEPSFSHFQFPLNDDASETFEQVELEPPSTPGNRTPSTAKYQRHGISLLS